MKKILSFLTLTLCFFLFSQEAKATHAAGGELIYELVPGTTNTYKFTFKFYRDCSGSAEPASFSLCYNNGCGLANQTVTMPKVVGLLPNGLPNGSPVSSGCPGFPTNCVGGSTPGYREWWYTANVTLPTQCNFYKFWVVLCCRNNGINNLTTSGSQNIFIDANFNNVVTQNNSSPYFSNPPIAYFCVNQLANINYAAIDPDGDSVAYEMIAPRHGTGCATLTENPIFAAGYSITNPFPSGTPSSFTLNPATGAISFIPTAIGKWVFTVKVKEYRNGVYIGYIIRDIQIYVDNCNIPSPTLTLNNPSIVNGTLINGTIQGCAGDTLSFCFTLLSTYPLSVLVPSDNHTVSIPGSTVVYTNTLTDSVYGCVNYPTTITDTGLHVLTVSVKDSSCQPPGFIITNTFSIPIYINPVTKAWGDTSICLGGSAPLGVSGGGLFHWTTLPGGSDSTSLSCTYCPNPVASPTVTTTYVVTSSQTSFCNQNSDTVTVTVATGPQLNITPATTTCVNATLQLQVTPNPANQAYNYSWAPAGNLSNPNIANPTVSGLTSNTTFTVTVVPQGVLACASVATVNVSVLPGFDIANNDTAICIGSNVQINPIGGSPQYTYTWTPPTFVSNPAIINPIITPTPQGVYPYTITASYPGCPDSSVSLTITVDPNPIVDAGPDGEICAGQTFQLLGTVLPAGTNYTYQWNPISDLNNSTILDPIFDGVVGTQFTLTATSPNGCVGTDIATVLINSSDFLTIEKDQAICPTDTVTLIAMGGNTWTWSPGMYVSDSTAAVVQAWPLTSTTFWVYATDIKGCKDTSKVNITVNPGAVLDAGDDHVIYPGETAQLYAQGNCSFFTWFPPNGLSDTKIKNPIASPSVTTRYFVTAQTESGCAATDSVDVIVSPETILELPNAFSPGTGTSINDALTIIVRGNAKLNTYRIFNRWGEEVFSTTDIAKGWDGRYKGVAQPMGVYVYVIDAVSSSGKRFYKQGNVTLIR